MLWGGVEHKWLRRFIAPIWLSFSMFYFSRNWKCFLQASLQMITLSLGYGGTDLVWLKILKRGFYGLTNSLIAVVNQNKKLFYFHIPLCLFICVYFGVFNPFYNARAEELAIGFIFGFLPIYMNRDKEEKEV